jgi:hypothetical protein
MPGVAAEYRQTSLFATAHTLVQTLHQKFSLLKKQKQLTYANVNKRIILGFVMAVIPNFRFSTNFKMKRKSLLKTN